MKWIETLTGNYTSSARVVDGTLIISLPQAITPIVWRMELGHVRASALEVRQQENAYMLTLKTPKGDVSDIAPFDTRGKAVQALMAVSRAMEHAHGQLRPYAAANSQGVTNLPAVRPEYKDSSKSASKGQFATGIIGTILLLGLITMFVNMTRAPQNIAPASGELAGVSSTRSGSTPVPTDTGVAESADDFLNKR